jgi:FAD/FMN-containing dehydrogenase
VDLSLMKRVEIDPRRGRVVIEPGVTSVALDTITQAFGTAVPLGSCAEVGVAWYALGGGESSLTPKFGYACDSISTLDVICANGKLKTTNDYSNTDLSRR